MGPAVGAAALAGTQAPPAGALWVDSPRGFLPVPRRHVGLPRVPENQTRNPQAADNLLAIRWALEPVPLPATPRVLGLSHQPQTDL